MAEEKKTPAKAEESKLAKILNWFKKLPGRIAKPFKNMVAELKKVTWPSKKKWISSSIMVLVFMLFMGVVIGLLDLGAVGVVKTLTPAQPAVATTAPAADATDAPVADATEAPVADPTEEAAATEAPTAEPTEAPAAE